MLLEYTRPKHPTLPRWAELVLIGCVFLFVATVVLIVAAGPL